MTMRRFLALGFMALALLIAVGASAQGTAAAQAPGFKKDPTFTEIGLRLNVSGTITGLEPSAEHPDDVKVFLTGYGTLKVDCFDNSGLPLGEATASFGSVQGLQYIPDSQLGGKTSVNVTTAAPGLTPQQAGCPSGATYTGARDTTYTIARVIVIQGGLIVMDETIYL
jgi:hypothetical protein